MSEPNADIDMKLVKDAVDRLSEYFDSVQIFCTRHEQGELQGTVNIAQGSGNWFARFGQVVSWVEKQQEEARMEMREK